MPENTFQCVDAKENLEACRNCKSFDFQMSKTQANSIICAKCGRFHKQLQPKIKSAGEILAEVINFARKHGE